MLDHGLLHSLWSPSEPASPGSPGSFASLEGALSCGFVAFRLACGSVELISPLSLLTPDAVALGLEYVNGFLDPILDGVTVHSLNIEIEPSRHLEILTASACPEQSLVADARPPRLIASLLLGSCS
jgi:hypothetical protein